MSQDQWTTKMLRFETEAGWDHVAKNSSVLRTCAIFLVLLEWESEAKEADSNVCHEPEDPLVALWGLLGDN